MRAAQLGLAGALVAAAVALAVAWFALGDAPRRLDDGQTIVWDVVEADVSELAVGGWRVRRDGAAWRFVGDGEPPADPDAVHEIVDALVEAHRGVTVPGDPAAFGLDAAVRVEVVHRGERLVLEVGADAPVGERTYVRRPGGPVVAVRGGVGEAVRAGPPSARATGAAEGDDAR